MANDFSEYSVNIQTEAVYYGSDVSSARAQAIAQKLAALVQDKFPGINVGFSALSGVRGPEDWLCDDIQRWVDSNWTRVL